MSAFEVSQPILNSPFEEPRVHWRIVEGEQPVRVQGRRTAIYYYRPPIADTGDAPAEGAGTAVELALVNQVRERLKAWREAGWPGVTRTTLELLQYWRRDGRQHRLFFAQLEAAETVIFLIEARADFRQGIEIPLDEPTEKQRAEGLAAFRRYACKMATGAGKTMVMGMLAAWSILNKVNDRGDARFSDVVLAVCPNVTIRNRLAELDPARGEASIYRTRDLVPPHLTPDLTKGRVLVTNWHVFEPQIAQVGGVSAKVAKAGRRIVVKESVTIGTKTTTARGKRYLTAAELNRQIAAGLLGVIEEDRDPQGNLKKVLVESVKYVESDASVVNRVLGREVGGKQNILVFNDEAHHAYRLRAMGEETAEDEEPDEEEDREYFFREATVWVDGLDRINKLRGINFCVDLSATPYFLERAGPLTNRPFPWVVSDFGLTDAIESGLVKIPQLAVRDMTGAEIAEYFNIWRWILRRLTPAERGGQRGSVKPEAVLRYAHHPIAMLGGSWDEVREEWAKRPDDPRPPVFILVCKNTRIAKLIYEWLAEDRAPTGVAPAHLEGFRNRDGEVNTIRVDSKVVHETDTGEAKSDESRWMRITLDTVGKTDWPRDRQGRPLYPEDFEELAKKMARPLHPPGRDIRCIVSVGMLTEGWDCNTVTHIIGLRPFMSQLLCEQVVGRGLRRSSYDLGENGLLTEEVAKILGVPFEVIPFKESKGGPVVVTEARHHVHAIDGKKEFEIRFPRVEGYGQAIRNRIAVNWDVIADLPLDPWNIPTEIQMKAGLLTNEGRPSLLGPGGVANVSLDPFRHKRRLQELIFDLARDITREYTGRAECEAPAHVLFPQIFKVVERYVRDKVKPSPKTEKRDVFLSPYYGWVIERLTSEIRPDASQGETPELPRYERSRRPGSTAEVDFWTGKPVREVLHCHLNYVVADTKKWEQSAAYVLDTHDVVECFVKNDHLGFAVPYLHNGEPHDYIPDFIVRLKDTPENFLILEMKGFDPLREVKRQAAERWVAAVNAERSLGRWRYAVADSLAAIEGILRDAAKWAEITSA